MQWSPRLEFDADLRTVVVAPTKNKTVFVLIDTADPVEFVVTYVRVSIMNAGLWSPLSPQYQVTSKCGPYQYLDDRWPKMLQAEGHPDQPIPSSLDPNTQQWNCAPCKLCENVWKLNHRGTQLTCLCFLTWLFWMWLFWMCLF